MSRFGLIGTITYDVITIEGKTIHEGLGGILYQAAVMCGLGYEVNLYTNLGRELEKEVQELTKEWRTLNKEGINIVSGPGNRVFLDYRSGRERIEVLKSVVPPISPDRILKDFPQLDFLVMVLNSGFDMESEEWEHVKKNTTCPIWLDIHSLPLEKKIGSPRECVSAVFITLGEEGVLLMDEKGSRSIGAIEGNSVVDSTGCGDVFCGGAAVYLSEGRDSFESAVYGMRIASAAVSMCGVSPIFKRIISSFR